MAILHKLLVPLSIALLVTGCLGDDEAKQPDPVTSSDDSHVSSITVTGTIRSINDMVPVDGGVTIMLATDDGETVTLLFPSLFTSPPPDQATIDLYEVVRQLEAEDRVRATGASTDHGILLEDVTVLK